MLETTSARSDLLLDAIASIYQWQWYFPQLVKYHITTHCRVNDNQSQSTLAKKKYISMAHIINRIIDHLYNDKKTLIVCTLVCSEWLPAARYHLIPSITLHHRNADRLLRALKAPFTKLGTSVRTLIITDQPAHISLDHLNEILPVLASQFTRLEILVLDGLDWCILDMGWLSSSHTTVFPKLIELQLLGCAFQDLGHLVAFICAFPKLDTLSVNRCKWDTRVLSTVSPQHHISRRLSDLMLLPAEPGLVNWLRSQTCRFVDTLYLDDVTRERIPAVRDFLRHLGPSLLQLRIRFADNIYVRDVQNANVDLSHNTRLNTLQIIVSLISLDNTPYKVYFLDWIPAFLAKIASTHLDTIKFRLLTYNPDLFDLNWREFDRVLALPVFAKLRQLHFNIADPSTSPIFVQIDPYDLVEEMELITYQYLPRASARGIIRVTCTVDPN
ncbi:hypothetical protein Hypma_007264 [Hypsizygus marmoreus]|uniref:F-box domain-containing protein n=1 Tax=Hypsizygus marmoreus TaxID=39966 RepID=A0A369KFH1_HYPMA|nr:hypothetical protein Hypma_007264 [Hypsizygus marmoreus]